MGVIVRRLQPLEVVGQRWARRAVTVVAGPGFGKSELLAQAVAENRLAPCVSTSSGRAHRTTAIRTVLARHLAGSPGGRAADSGRRERTGASLAAGRLPSYSTTSTT